MGHYSRLVTFFPDSRGYAEDIVLNLPFAKFPFAEFVKSIVSHPSRQAVKNTMPAVADLPPRWQSGGALEQMLIALREKWWQPRVTRFMRNIDFYNFDFYCFEAGMDFFTDARTIRQLQSLGKKIAVLYTGSDLRTRGIFPAVDAAADFRASFELDHQQLHPDLHYLPVPFDTKKIAFSPHPAGEVLRIGHAPTNREAKGSAAILAVLQQLRINRNIEIVLIENVPHDEALKLKHTCDIFIDQIGDLGYGINSLEALAMGIPTCTCLTAGFRKFFPEHPFVEITAENLLAKLTQLADQPAERERLVQLGRQWVEKHHDSRMVVKKIHQGAGF